MKQDDGEKRSQKKGMYVTNEVSIQTPQKCPRLNTAKTESKLELKVASREVDWVEGDHDLGDVGWLVGPARYSSGTLGTRGEFAV
jgi:hypothetical protein